jgi:gliding motility-associated lipoprotein GldB
MNFMRLLLWLIGAALALTACSSQSTEPCTVIPETSSIQVNIPLVALEDSLSAVSTKQQLVHFFSRHTDLRDAFFARAAFPDDSVFINERFRRFSNPYIDTLLTDVKTTFKDGADLQKQLKDAFANLKYYYPDFKVPTVKTVITGLESDVLVSDSLIAIGMDYYLGPNARYKPDLYGYMQRRYTPQFIVPSIMLLYGIDHSFNKTDLSDRTVLAEMISYGKAYYFAKRMLPCVPDSVLIGYTAEEMAGARRFEDLIWSRFVEDEVIYSTNHQMKQRYIAERPKTLEVGEKCPGRIGTWVGWQIVKKYMESHPEVTLPQLMQMENANEIFKQSGYRPQVTRLPSRAKSQP